MSEAAIPALIAGSASVFTGALSYNAQRQAQRQQAELIAYQKKFLDRDLARDNAFAPAIDRTLQEYVDEPKPKSQAATLIARSTVAIESELAMARRKLRECSQTYCAPAVCAQEAQLAVQAGIAKADAIVAAYRSDEARLRVLNDKRRADIITTVGNATRGAFLEGQRGIQALMGYYARQQEQASKAFAGSLKELGYQATKLYNELARTDPGKAQWDEASAADQRVIEQLRQELAQPMPDLGPQYNSDLGDTSP